MEREKAQQREIPSIRHKLQKKNQPRTIDRNNHKNLELLKNNDKIKEILDNKNH